MEAINGERIIVSIAPNAVCPRRENRRLAEGGIGIPLDNGSIAIAGIIYCERAIMLPRASKW